MRNWNNTIGLLLPVKLQRSVKLRRLLQVLLSLTVGDALRAEQRKEAMKAPAWEPAVAMAVPAAPRGITTTSSRSNTILTTAATMMKNSGRLASPMPRRMPHTAL